jgi:YVTN family beta-propeller protein
LRLAARRVLSFRASQTSRGISPEVADHVRGRSAVLLILLCLTSLALGQYVETTIYLSDSVSGLNNVSSLLFHLPNNTIYVGGADNSLVAVNAQTNSKLRRMDVGDGPHLLCSDPPGNKVYCANDDATMTVIDGATNQTVKALSVQQRLTELVYNQHENKLYCGNTTDSFVRVIDCSADSVVALIPTGSKPGWLCYNPRLNRIYCANKDRDEVTVIDCATDTVITSVWVRGVEPRDICYDSATNCVYTANGVSSSVSVIDCAGDSVLRLVPAGRWPSLITPGPPGKVYCACYDDSVSVICVSSVKTVFTGHRALALSFDPANNKVYCAGEYAGRVTVIDATRDTVLVDIGTGSYPVALCYNPVGNNTCVACDHDNVVDVIGGASNIVEAVIPFFVCSPGPLCYNTTSNHLYCLDQQNDLLFVIDGDSNRVLRTINIRRDPLDIMCTPLNKQGLFHQLVRQHGVRPRLRERQRDYHGRHWSAAGRAVL